MKRYIFKKYILSDDMSIKTIHPIMWMLGWMFYLGTLLFFIYWVFAWGLRNGKIIFIMIICKPVIFTLLTLNFCYSGGGTVSAWGTIFWITFLQDLAAIEVIKVYVYYIVGANSLRQQMKDIQRVIKSVLSKLIRQGSSYDPSYVRLCQHMQGASRASHTKELWELPSARLLREFDDDDIATVKQTKHKKVAVYWTVLLGIPIVLSSITSDFISDIFKECIPPLIVGAVLLLNAVLANISIYLVTIPYAVLVTVYFYNHLVYQPAKKRLIADYANGNSYSSRRLYYFDKFITFCSCDGLNQCFCPPATSGKIHASEQFSNVHDSSIDGSTISSSHITTSVTFNMHSRVVNTLDESVNSAES